MAWARCPMPAITGEAPVPQSLLFCFHIEIRLGRFAGGKGYLLLALHAGFVPDRQGVGARRQAIDRIRPVIASHREEWMIEDDKPAIHPWMHVALDAEFLGLVHRRYCPAGID